MGAAAHARAEALPARRPGADERPAVRPAERRRPGAATGPRYRRRLAPLPLRLLVFGILLAVLAVGRVTLSFAVVQKNLQTDAVTHQYRVVKAENQRLAEKAATLSSSLAVRNTAIDRYHLVVSPTVQFVTVHPHRLTGGNARQTR